jgi:23S rRNA (adenine1618-N6)-methyltransferase
LNSPRQLHPRNRHLGEKGASYDFDKLTQVNPDLAPLVITGPRGNQTLDFFDPKSVKELNRALILTDYKIQFWDLPEQFLCPAVPGRADYIHYLADLLAEDHEGVIPTGKRVQGLDIGTGANLIYPIIGSHEYGWRFVGTDIEAISINCAKQLCNFNPRLKQNIKLRLQTNSSDIFNGIIGPDDRFAFSMCNPPFHASQQDAELGTKRKLNNLSSAETSNVERPTLNFSGQSNELWCSGGERQFVSSMIKQSQVFASQVLWFTSLVSKRENIPVFEKELDKIKARQVKVIEMAQGNKVSRFIAWTFLSEEERSAYFD